MTRCSEFWQKCKFVSRGHHICKLKANDVNIANVLVIYIFISVLYVKEGSFPPLCQKRNIFWNMVLVNVVTGAQSWVHFLSECFGASTASDWGSWFENIFTEIPSCPPRDPGWSNSTKISCILAENIPKDTISFGQSVTMHSWRTRRSRGNRSFDKQRIFIEIHFTII